MTFESDYACIYTLELLNLWNSRKQVRKWKRDEVFNTLNISRISACCILKVALLHKHARKQYYFDGVSAGQLNPGFHADRESVSFFFKQENLFSSNEVLSSTTNGLSCFSWRRIFSLVNRFFEWSLFLFCFKPFARNVSSLGRSKWHYLAKRKNS